MRNQDEIDQEIKILRELKQRVPSSSAFGDDNDGAIEAQIKVLEEGIEPADMDDNFDEDEDTYVYDSALGAAEWLSGRSDESPSGEWSFAL